MEPLAIGAAAGGDASFPANRGGPRALAGAIGGVIAFDVRKPSPARSRSDGGFAAHN